MMSDYFSPPAWGVKEVRGSLGVLEPAVLCGKSRRVSTAEDCRIQ
jgi:hypothetical protein